MSLDLEAIKARRAALFDGGEAWQCRECELCHACHRLNTCDAHDDDDVPALVAEVERLRAEVEGLTYAYDSLKSDADAVVGGLKLDYADCESVGMEWMRRARRAEALLEGVRRPELSARNFKVDL